MIMKGVIERGVIPIQEQRNEASNILLVERANQIRAVEHETRDPIG